MRWTDSLRTASLRGHLTLVVASGTILLCIVLVAGFNIVLRAGLRSDADDLLRARASAALASVDVKGGNVRVREVPGDSALDGLVWVFADGKAIERPRAPAAALAGATAAARTPHRFRDVPSLDLRFVALPVARHGRTVATVATGASLAPYEQTARRALVASIVLGTLVMAAMLAMLRATIAAALRPVDRMTAEAAAWSLDDIDHRFADAGSRDELARLGSTFNDLLGRLAASFRHEQRFSAEVSHELRTPLARLVAESELALRRDRQPQEYRAALQMIERDARAMERVIETLLATARTQSNPRAGTSDAMQVATAVVDAAPSTDVALELREPPGDLRLGLDGDLAERVVAPVVANAVRHARERAVVEVRAHNGSIEFVVTDDGPGVAAADRDHIFTPGFRTSAGGAGLGLALARRLAEAAGGDVYLDSAAASGARFVVVLPAA